MSRPIESAPGGENRVSTTRGSRHEGAHGQQLRRRKQEGEHSDHGEQRHRTPVPARQSRRERETRQRDSHHEAELNAAVVDGHGDDGGRRDAVAQATSHEGTQKKEQDPREIEIRQKRRMTDREMKDGSAGEGEQARKKEHARQVRQFEPPGQQHVHAHEPDEVVNEDVHLHRKRQRHRRTTRDRSG